jgi:beta-glucosidase
MLLRFPDNFLWGASTSSHQVEGNTHNDWSEWEIKNSKKLADKAQRRWLDWQQKKFPEILNPKNYVSGKACDHYNLFEKDFDIAKKLGHNTHRFSIEWSRIEPKEGVFDKSELAHYKAVVHALKTRGMEPFVTLWHWALPVWLSKKGGVLSRNFDRYFARYAEFVVNGLKDDVSFWITLNEPASVIGNAYITGNWPPKKMNPICALEAYSSFARAHNLAYSQIHKISSSSKVGMASILSAIEPRNKKSPLDRALAKYARHYANKKFYELTEGKHDFIAVNYYFHRLIGLTKKKELSEKMATDMGWEIYPEGIYRVLDEVKKYSLPVYITENGLADTDDFKRADFIKGHLAQVHRAIEEGVDVRGYFHWSLLDNFEWDKGFWPRFGLVEVDYKTQERKIRKSALYYKDIISKNGVEL